MSPLPLTVTEAGVVAARVDEPAEEEPEEELDEPAAADEGTVPGLLCRPEESELQPTTRAAQSATDAAPSDDLINLIE